MRYIRYGFYALLMIVLVLLALANREIVTLAVLPQEMAGIFPVSVKLPLFVVIMLSILFGLMVGYVLEYFREYGIRREASKKKREAAALKQEVKQLREESGEQEDDVLRLLN